MYVYENELAADQTPIHRKRIGPAPGGGRKVYADFHALPFCELERADLVDTSDLCRIFGTSARTVYRWMADHSLRPVHKVGREYLFSKDQVLRWFAQHRPRPGRPRASGRQ